MQDDKFLHQALEHSFLHPHITETDALLLTDNTANTDFWRLSCPHCSALSPFYMHKSQRQAYISSLPRALNKRQNPRLYQELETFKHDLTENIIIPADYPKLTAISDSLDMPRVNRCAAQKKKVAATLFPADFTKQIRELRPRFTQTIKAASKLISEHPLAHDYGLVCNFSESYKKYNWKISSNLFLRLNRRRFRRYLNEAAQLLKSGQPVNDDFITTHTFIGEPFAFCQYRLKQIRGYLWQLLDLLKQLSHEPKLLYIAQELLVSEHRFSAQLKPYHQNNAVPQLGNIGRFMNELQNYYNAYAKLVYLNSVRQTFEQQLDSYPQPLPPALPTVSPQDELKKIAKIVEESRQIPANSGKLKKLCEQALNEYNSTEKRLHNSLKSFSPTPKT